MLMVYIMKAIIYSPSQDGKLQKLTHQATSNSCKKENNGLKWFMTFI